MRVVPSVGVAPLGNYGGAQPTAPLVAASPALDAGNDADCPALDQRGMSRVGTCDIGAYESRGFRMTFQGGAEQTATSLTAFPLPVSAQFFSDFAEPLGPGGVLVIAGPPTGATLSPSATHGLLDAAGWVTKSLTAGSLGGTYAVTITAAGIATPVVGTMTNSSPGSVAKDNFSQALVVSQLPYSTTFDAAGATTAQDDPQLLCVGNQLPNSVWFRYTPNSSELVQINTFGSSYDTVLGVFTGTQGSLTSIGCNDDTSSSTASSLNLNLIAGATYHIEVASYGSTAGSLTLNMRSCGAACRPSIPLMSLPPLSLTTSLADGGSLASPAGVTFTVPPQTASLPTSDALVLAYTTIPWPAKSPGSAPLLAFRLDATVADAFVAPLSNPATVEVQLDPAAVPSGQRAWLFEWSPQGVWLLLPNQHFDPLTGLLTVRTDHPGNFGLAVADIRRTYLPSVGMP